MSIQEDHVSVFLDLDAMDGRVGPVVPVQIIGYPEVYASATARVDIAMVAGGEPYPIAAGETLLLGPASAELGGCRMVWGRVDAEIFARHFRRVGGDQ